MNLALILVVSVVFLISCLTSGYESKAGVPKHDQ